MDPYELNDPKHPTFAERVFDQADEARKRAKEEGPNGMTSYHQIMGWHFQVRSSEASADEYTVTYVGPGPARALEVLYYCASLDGVEAQAMTDDPTLLARAAAALVERLMDQVGDDD